MIDFRALGNSLVGLATALVWLPSHSQSFPAKPIRIIVPLVAGESLDTLSRMIAEKMSQGFSQVVYVENRPGASSDFGTGLLAKSPPDGYNLGVNKTTSNPNVVENDLFIATSPLDPPGFPRQWFDYKQVQKHLHGPGSVQARLPPARPP